MKAGVLGALLELKLFLYCGAAVNGEWQAGVETIIKNGVEAPDWFFRKLTACRFYNVRNKNIMTSKT